MRDLLDKIDTLVLQEATGLSGRRPGDPFTSTSGKTITFNDIKFFPEGGGKFTPEELDQAVQEVSQQVDNIYWQNKKTNKSGGFALVSFTGDGQQHVIGRYLDNVKADPRQNYVENRFIINGEQFNFSSKVAQKEQSGLSPLDLLQDRDNQTIPSIMNQLAKSLGTDSPLYAVAHAVAMGNPLPLTFNAPAGVSFTAFRDYFCEILQPIALIKGQFTGNAIDAADRFLDGTFDNCTVTFGATKTGGLTDSVLTNPEGKTLLLSSKGGKGAEASAKNLYDEVNKLRGSPEGQRFIKKYSKEVKILDDIVAAGMHGSPLKLGVNSGIIDMTDVEQIKALREMPKVNIEQIDGLKLSPKLKALAKSRETDNPESVNLYYHLVAAIAHKVAEHINSTTNFPKAAADILNNGALVQVYTKAIEGKNSWTLKEFETVYPSDAIKGVFLSAGKGYYSTDIKGNFTFKIDKGGNKPTTKSAPAAATKPSLAKAAADIVNESNVGRKKRKYH